MNELKPCPFCDGSVKIVVMDDEGNIHREDGYEQEPWSGLTYGLIHDDKNSGDDCPIATFFEDDRTIGRFLYDSKEEATEAWNRRADHGTD